MMEDVGSGMIEKDALVMHDESSAELSWTRRTVRNYPVVVPAGLCGKVVFW